MKHKYIIRIRKPRFSIYWGGSHCLIEIDAGRHVFQIFTRKGLFNYFKN